MTILGGGDASDRRWSPAAILVASAALVVAGVAGLLDGLNPLRVWGVCTVGAVGIGIWRHRPDTAPTWRDVLQPLAQLGTGLAALVITEGGLTRDGGHGASVLTSTALLIGYILIAGGLVRIFFCRLPGRAADVLVEAGLAAFGAGVALWVLAAHAIALKPGLILLPIVLTALDTGLLTIAGRLIVLPGDRVASYRYLVLGVVYLLGAHLTATMTLFFEGHPATSVPTVLLGFSFGLFGLAALDPSSGLLMEPVAGDPPRFSPAHVALVVMAMLVGPCAVGLAASRRAVVSPVTAIGIGLVAVALAAYICSLLWERTANEHRVHYDHLTELPNRTLYFDRLARALAHARRSKSTVGVMFVDLDRFKEVNDTFGHSSGDALLKKMADRLRGCLRDEDTVARLSGDEFAILLPHLTDADTVVTVAHRIISALAEPVVVAEEGLRMTASIGIAVYPGDGSTPNELVGSADTAMYRAKEKGRNTYEIFSPALATRAHERRTIEAGLIAALGRDELVLHYQPIVDIRRGCIVGAEALVRWEHPERGLLLPGHFIPIAEQSDLVVSLGDFVLRSACEQIAAWARAGLPPITLAVNVSARQLSLDMSDRVAAVLRSTGIDPAALVLELTESAAVDNLDRCADTLTEVRQMGAHWAIDDFGTGYCGLVYLSRLPVDALKIDRSFVQGTSAADRSIVSAIIAMGHSLGHTIIAEGVETQPQLDFLTSHGCDRVQGFLHSRPVPAARFEELLVHGPMAPQVEVSVASRAASLGTNRHEPS